MKNKNGIKTPLRDSYKEITIAQPFVKRLTARDIKTTRNRSIVESKFNLRNLFNAHVAYFVKSIDDVYNSSIRDRIDDATLFIPPDIHPTNKALIAYFKWEHLQLINFMLDYSRPEPAELKCVQEEFLSKFKYFYNDPIEVGTPIYNAFLKDIKAAIEHNNLTAIVALAAYNDLWLKLSKDVKRGAEKYKKKHKEAVRARGLYTTEDYYPIRATNKQDPRTISAKRYNGILRIFSFEYDISHNSKGAQERILQSKDPRTSLGSKKEFFTARPLDSDEMKVLPIEENRNMAKRGVEICVEQHSNPILYVLARRELLYDIHNPFFDENILKDKKIKIADREKYERIQKWRTNEKLLNEYLNAMDQNIADRFKQPQPTPIKRP